MHETTVLRDPTFKIFWGGGGHAPGPPLSFAPMVLNTCGPPVTIFGSAVKIISYIPAQISTNQSIKLFLKAFQKGIDSIKKELAFLMGATR